MPPTHRVLVPFELPDAEPLPAVLVDALGPMEVVVLGHYGLPEQTPPEIARDQFEDDANAELDDLARPFEGRGLPVTTRLVFGKVREKTIDRVAVEEDCDVILTPGHVTAIDRLFVPLRGETNLEPIMSFVGELLTATDATVTLFHATEPDEDPDGETVLADARTRLLDAGFAAERITTQLSGAEEVGRTIVDLGDEFDLLVLGETEPSLRERILGAIPAQVTADTDDPTFVVRKPENT